MFESDGFIGKKHHPQRNHGLSFDVRHNVKVSSTRKSRIFLMMLFPNHTLIPTTFYFTSICFPATRKTFLQKRNSISADKITLLYQYFSYKLNFPHFAALMSPSFVLHMYRLSIRNLSLQRSQRTPETRSCRICLWHCKVRSKGTEIATAANS